MACRVVDHGEALGADLPGDGGGAEIYQDILRQNNVRFICRQQGAGGYLKHLIGSASIPDYIYVKSDDYEQARELYETYIQNNGQIEILDSEED